MFRALSPHGPFLGRKRAVANVHSTVPLLRRLSPEEEIAENTRHISSQRRRHGVRFLTIAAPSSYLVMRRPMATLADFPVELNEYIILLAARACALDDKPTLVALSRASRAIHAIVQPILVNTLFVTTSNLQVLLAYAERRVFATTRHLVVEPGVKHGRVDAREALCRALEDSKMIFSTLEIFCGPLDVLRNLAHCSRAKHVVLVPPASNDWMPWLGGLSRQQLSNLSCITHIHGGRDILPFLSNLKDQVTESSVTHAVLELEPTIEPEMSNTILPANLITLLLGFPKLERLCVRVRPDVWVGSLVEKVVARELKESKDARVWVYLVGDSDPPPYDLRMMLNSDYWLMGTPFIGNA